MLALAETERFETEIRAAAEQEQLQFVIQPFDGPACYEFRRQVANGAECLGLLYDTTDFVLFRRHLSLRYIRFHEHLWWLGFLVGKKSEDFNYHEVGRIKHDNVNREILVRTIRKYLPEPVRPNNSSDEK